MPGLKLLLLGAPRIEYDEAPVELGRRKALALLVYLAATGEHHHRDTLATLLWPTSSQRNARASLRRDLSVLNTALGDEWLDTNQELVGLRRRPDLWLDVERFHYHLNACRQHEHDSDDVCSACLAPLSEAAALYRDDFLAGFTLPDCPAFDEWQFFEAERLRQACASVLERLVVGYSAQEDYQQAIPFAQRWVALDPLHELAHRHLMQLYACTDQWAAAVRQYRKCKRVLQEELGVPPGDETTEVYQAIKSRQVFPSSEIEPVSESGETTSSHRLPAQTTSFIGRIAELGAVRTRLSDPKVRLLTLTGPGGVGKTRLGLHAATEAASAFEDGVYYVPLAPVRDPALVATTIADTLGVRIPDSASVVDVLKEHVQDKQMLLMLDNFEHVLPAAPVVTELLTAASPLTILVTSRAVLHAYGEWTYPIPPMTVPDTNQLPSLDRLAQYEAVQLFVERATAAQPAFELTPDNAYTVAEICARLDGLPLAIELAAVRIRLLPPQKLLQQVQSRLQTLTGGATDKPARQQTLRDTIEWSYDLLDRDEQLLFQRLAVFAGGCTLEAAEAVGAVAGDINVLDGIESLVDNSLLAQSNVKGEPRFYMLETLREYALGRLHERGEAEVIRRQHACFFLELAEEAEPHMYSAEQLAWLHRLAPEHDNIRVALAWALDHEIEVGLRLAGSLGRFWHFHSHHSEGRDWLTKALQQTDEADAELASARAKALNLAGMLSFFLGDMTSARDYSAESVELWRTLDDRRGLADALADLGIAVALQDSFVQAEPLLDESITLFRHIKDTQGLVRALFWYSYAAYLQQDYGRARSAAEESVTLGREIKDTSNVGASMFVLGLIALHQGDYAEAQVALENALQLFRTVEDEPGMAVAFEWLGVIAFRQAQYEDARRYLEESVRAYRESNNKPRVALQLLRQGYVALQRHDWNQAAAAFEESLVLFFKVGAQTGITLSVGGLAQVAVAQKQRKRALVLFGATEALLQDVDSHAEGGIPLDQYDRLLAEYQRYMAAVLVDATDDAVAPAFARGRAMSLEQVVQYALSE